MTRQQKSTSLGRSPETATQPFRYEIRVRGRLDGKAWTEWFAILPISIAEGETLLQGVAPDHAALYGLLARLRDLAIPLVSVTVLDAAAEEALRQEMRRQALWMNLSLLGLYGLLAGGVTAVAVFLSQAQLLHPTVSIAFLFAILGGLAFTLSEWSGYLPWRWLAFALWPASVLSFFIFTSQTNLLPTEISIATILFLSASGSLFLVQHFRRKYQQLRGPLTKCQAPPGPNPAAAERAPVPSKRGRKRPTEAN